MSDEDISPHDERVYKLCKMEGYRYPGSKGWNGTFILLSYRSLNTTRVFTKYYGGLFEDGMDFVPETKWITSDQVKYMRNYSKEKGWTEVMNEDQIREIAGNVHIGDTKIDHSNDFCILF
jgi:hypothetical protein